MIRSMTVSVSANPTPDSAFLICIDTAGCERYSSAVSPSLAEHARNGLEYLWLAQTESSGELA